MTGHTSSHSTGTPSRRAFLKTAAIAGGAAVGITAAQQPATATVPGPQTRDTVVGTIRWDAWVGPDSSVGASVNRSLSPDKYRFRLPYYAQITTANPVLINADFDSDQVGMAPAGWNVVVPTGGQVAVAAATDRPGNIVRLANPSGSGPATMTRTFTPFNQAITARWHWKQTGAGPAFRALLASGSTAAVEIASRTVDGASQLSYRLPGGSWTPVQTITANTWYAIKVIVDLTPPEGAAPWVDIFVNDERKVHHAALSTPATSIDRISFHTADMPSEVFVDAVNVEVTESVNINGATQQIMDEEIRFARDAGIDYWAFVYYPQQPLARARDLYLSSSRKSELNWCAILDSNFLTAYDTNLPTLITHFGGTTYQRVLGGRPLVYFFNDGATAERVTKLRAASAAAGQGDPYIVVMALDAQAAATLKAATGADAVSRYWTGGWNGIPYAQFAATEAGLWADYATSSGTVVPWVTTGVDKRPRYEYPMPWEPNHVAFKDLWVQQAQPAEIADHLSDSLEWSTANPEKTPAATVLVYAWNEFDEGGWICPTMSEMQNGGSPLRLDAIRGVLSPSARSRRRRRWPR